MHIALMMLAMLAFVLGGEARSYAAGASQIAPTPVQCADPAKPEAETKHPDHELALSAYQAGRITAVLMKMKAAGDALDDAQITRLKSAYKKLGVDPAFIGKAAEGSYQELGRVLVIEAARKIGSITPHGDGLKAGFSLGMEVYIVERLLSIDAGALSAQNRREVIGYLRGPLLEHADAAGYSAKFVAAVNETETTLEGDDAVPRATRKKWNALVQELDDAELSRALMSREPKKPASGGKAK